MPRTLYAKNGDVHITYQVHGQGPVDNEDIHAPKGIPGDRSLFAAHA